MLDLVIQNQQHNSSLPDEEKIQHWAASAYLGDDDVQVTLRIVDAEESQALNQAYREKDYPTNVLSFPMDMPDEFLELLEMKMLGDLVVCASVVEKEAAEQHKSEDSHWAHMLVHGMLHLQGYDHIEDDDAEIMETLETEILNKLGFTDPYQMITE